MNQEQNFTVGLDELLRTRILEEYIHDGALFGSVMQSALTPDEMMQLTHAGWTQHNYHDAPTMEPPQSIVDWTQLKARHRDHTLHTISHRLPGGAPWVGTRQEILEELLSSLWDKQEEELRTLLHAFAFASMWTQDQPHAENALETRETFFFYTEKMRASAQNACDYAAEAPHPEDEFWEMVSALSQENS